MRRISRITRHENQLSLPFGQRRRGVAISYERRQHLFVVLITVSIISILAYIYAINATARNIAERASLEREIAGISTSLDSLEFAYIELRNNVTIELAYAKGFKEEKSPLFVSRSRAASLSFNTANR